MAGAEHALAEVGGDPGAVVDAPQHDLAAFAVHQQRRPGRSRSGGVTGDVHEQVAHDLSGGSQLTVGDRIVVAVVGERSWRHSAVIVASGASRALRAS